MAASSPAPAVNWERCLQLRNQVVPSLIGDSYQTGDLNQMAKQFADRVNQLLTAGNITAGPPAVPGVPIFTYDTR